MHQQTTLRPPESERHTNSEIENIIVMIRLHLYNRELPCGAKPIREYMASEYAIDPLPSERTITRTLSRHGLTNRRTGLYEE